MYEVNVISTTIPPNETRSGVIDLGNHTIVGIEMPEAFNGTTLTFQSKARREEDPQNPIGLEDWDDLYDSAGAQISWTVAPNRVVVPTAAHAAAMAPVRYLRIIAGTGQGVTREIRLICK